MKRKFSKKYKQMMKKNRKAIMGDAKAASKSPWDYGFGLDMFVKHLYFMRDYYSLGENVWGCESEDDVPSRKEILDMILEEYEGWQNCDDKYMKVIFMSEPHAQEEIDELVAQGYVVRIESENSPLKDAKETVFLYKFADYRENVNKMLEEYTAHRTKFFELLGKYIEYLWD